MTSTTRQSSLYTLRVQDADQAALLAVALNDDIVPAGIQDHGPAHVGFRAPDDATATTYATAALRAAGLTDVAATLTTGLGVHRRTVAVQDAGVQDVPHVITRDGAPVSAHESESAAFGALLRVQPMSTEWAIQHEGYAIVPATAAHVTILSNAHDDRHPYRTHHITRDGDYLTCDCSPTNRFYSPRLAPVDPSGIAASASRFD